MIYTLLSNINDNNIFHIFAFDIIKYYNLDYKYIYINDEKINIKNSTQIWRLFVMKKLYSNSIFIYDKSKNIINIKYHNSYNCWKFIKYPIDSHILDIKENTFY